MEPKSNSPLGNSLPRVNPEEEPTQHQTIREKAPENLTVEEFKQSPIMSYSGVFLLIPLILTSPILGMFYYLATPMAMLSPLILIAVFVVIAALGRQLKYIKLRMLRQDLFFRLKLLAICAIALPSAAAILGDLGGAAYYNSAPGNGFFGIFVGLLIGITYATFLQITTRIYIATKGQSQILNTLGTIAYWLLWLPIVAISYFVFTIAYSAHDPSTE